MVDTSKKKYAKPELFYESLALSQSIATGCEGIAMFGESVCPVKVDVSDIELMIFQTAGAGCEFVPPNPDDLICYHAPSESNNVFGS